MKIGAYFKHEKHMDVCVRVLKAAPDEGWWVEWYNLGYTGNPWPLGQKDIVYLNGNWEDISNKIHIPRAEWK